MEQITKQSDSLAHKLNDSLTTSQKSSAPSDQAPPWLSQLLVIAQDKRHDLAPGILALWKEKLQTHPDAEVTEALRLYAGQYFPSVDEIVELIERRRLRAAEGKQDSKTSAEYQENWNQIERFMDAHDGKTPQQLWCEENQALIASLNEKLVTSKTGKAE